MREMVLVGRGKEKEIRKKNIPYRPSQQNPLIYTSSLLSSLLNDTISMKNQQEQIFPINEYIIPFKT
jgi:hypothetical protein